MNVSVVILIFHGIFPTTSRIQTGKKTNVLMSVMNISTIFAHTSKCIHNNLTLGRFQKYLTSFPNFSNQITNTSGIYVFLNVFTIILLFPSIF